MALLEDCFSHARGAMGRVDAVVISAATPALHQQMLEVVSI